MSHSVILTGTTLAMVAACTATASNNIPPALHACSMIEMIDWADPLDVPAFCFTEACKHACFKALAENNIYIYIYILFICIFQYRFFVHREIIIL